MARAWQFFLHKEALSYLLIAGLFLTGLYAVFFIRKESTPEIQVPVAIVRTILPGASPLDVERLVTDKIERALQSLDDVDTITSRSRTGVSTVVVEFAAEADLTRSLQDVKDAIDEIKPDLPDDAEEPSVEDVNFADQPILFISLAGTLHPLLLREDAEDLADTLRRIPQVSRVEIVGVEEREIQVLFDETALVAHSLDLEEVARVLGAQNAELPLGSIETRGVSYTLNLAGRIEDSAALAEIPLPLPDGGTISLGSIARITDGLKKPEMITRVSIDGAEAAPAAVLRVYKQRGADIIRTTQEVRRTVEAEVHARHPYLAYAFSLDAGADIRQSLGELASSGLLTILLVLASLLVFIGWREALIASLAIPLSFLFAFAVLYGTGSTLNFVSLFALILSVGILVDSAIVMVEAIHANMKEAQETGEERLDAAERALTAFHYPLTTGTLTTLAVFLPLFTISGITGKFIAAIPATIIYVLGASLVVALAFIPVISVVLLRRRVRSSWEARQERLTRALRAWYRRRILLIYGNKRRENWFIGTLIVLFFAALALPVVGWVRVEFFPKGDVDFMYVEVELPQGATLEETAAALSRLEPALYEVDAIASFSMVAGRGSAFNENAEVGARYGAIDIDLKKERAQTSREVVALLTRAYAGINDFAVRVNQLNDGPPVGAPIALTLSGEDLPHLFAAGREVESLLQTIPGTRNVRTTARDDTAEFVLEFDRAKASRAGLRAGEVARALRGFVEGVEATEVIDGGTRVRVLLKMNPEAANTDPHRTNVTTVDRLLSLTVRGKDGTALPLSEMLTPRFAPSLEEVRHKELQRTVSVTAEVQEGVRALEVLDAFRARAARELTLPPGVTLSVGGENEEVAQSFIDMFRALLMGILLMLVVLVVQFNSYKHTLFVLSVIPLSLIGVIVGIFITGQAISFPTILGFVALSGIVVNNAIILLDVINTLRAQKPHEKIDTIVLEGAVARLRPILLTSVTTVVGVVPLIWVSEVWKPIAYSIMFGLSFAVVLTLILLPVLYRRFHDRSALWGLLCALAAPLRTLYFHRVRRAKSSTGALTQRPRP